MKVKFFDPARGYDKIKPEIDSEIQRVFGAGDLILRDDVEKFEKNLAKFVGTKYAVALNSGTDALYLSLWALGVGKFHTVGVPSYTYVATAQVVDQIGAIIEQYDMDVGEVLDADAIIVAHLEGLLSKYPNDNIGDLRCKVPLIEDACQALGALKNPTSDIQCWSFYPAKILGAYGDAGAITTNNKELADKIRLLRNHHKDDNYSDWGVNSRMDNLQAAILNVKLKYLPDVLNIRQAIAERYNDKLKDIEWLTLPENQKGRVWQDYVIRLKSEEQRDGLFEKLKGMGVETMKNEYPWPIKKLPLATKYESETLRIPCNENLTEEEVDYVIDCIKQF